MITVLSLLVVHGLIGGADVLVNHEWREHLPARLFARSEEALHSARELIFGILFGGLAWLEWHGLLAWGLVFLLVLEFLISWRDTLLEDRTRSLSALERSMHTLLFINFGAYVACLVPILFQWQSMPTGFRVVHYGALSWILSTLAAVSLVWAVRDLLSCILLGRKLVVESSALPQRRGLTH